MRVAIFALGTRGDVQPFVQIAHDLETAGHDVQFATPPGMDALTRMLDNTTVTEYGPDVSSFLNSGRGQRIILSGRTSWLMRELFALNNQYAAEIADTVDELARNSDVLIGGSLSEEKTAAAAVRYSAALHSIHFAPFAKNSAVPHSLFDVRDLGTFGNRRTYDVFTALRTAASIDDVVRAGDIGWSDRLSPRLTRAAAMTTTDAYSRHLISDSVGARDSRIDPVGFIHLSDGLRGRLSAGDDTDAAIEWIDGDDTDVVYVGFGSMPVGDPSRLQSLLLTLIEGLDVRIVWCTGWSAASSRSGDPRILIVHDVDHSRLMTRCVAVVHHGGAGTTAEAARAGKPQVIMPFFWDQPFWGRMVVRMGVGTCVRYTRATPRTVFAAVRTALSSPVRANAQSLALRMRQENGRAAARTALCGSQGQLQ